jgi:hypothetical protein
MAALFTVRPISDRTAFRGEAARKNSPFGVTYAQTLQLLERELDFLDARNVVMEADVAEYQIRNDGQIKAGARAASPAVRLAFDSTQGALTYATDRFVKPYWKRNVMEQDWQHNLYAIAKGLEALRMVDRYAITEHGEQYLGFKALPAGRAMPASHMTSDDAYALLERVAIGDEGVLRDRQIARMKAEPLILREVFREARKVCHPDVRDGDHTVWHQVEEAGRLLGLLS